jgi:hypothetical protein
MAGVRELALLCAAFPKAQQIVSFCLDSHCGDHFMARSAHRTIFLDDLRFCAMRSDHVKSVTGWVL